MSATPHGQNARRHSDRWLPWPLVALVATLFWACSSTTRRETPPLPAEGETPKRGGYYKDDGPGANPPPNLEAIPDATPRLESLHRFANRPYAVFGRDYVPATTLRAYKERGIDRGDQRQRRHGNYRGCRGGEDAFDVDFAAALLGNAKPIRGRE